MRAKRPGTDASATSARDADAADKMPFQPFSRLVQYRRPRLLPLMSLRDEPDADSAADDRSSFIDTRAMAYSRFVDAISATMNFSREALAAFA